MSNEAIVFILGFTLILFIFGWIASLSSRIDRLEEIVKSFIEK